MRRGLVLACGGSLGHAWMVGALARLERTTGLDPRSADVIVGTSAGSVLAAQLGAGVAVSDLVLGLRAASRAARGALASRAHLPPWPAGAPLSLSLAARGARRGAGAVALAGLLPAGRARDLAVARPVRDLPAEGGWVAHPRCWVVAIDAATGARVAFGRAGAPRASIVDAVAASCGVPGWVAPTEIGGRLYLDGGVASPTSADLLVGEGLDEVVVVSPMTSRRPAPPASLLERAERVLRAHMNRALSREVHALEASGCRVVRIEPTAVELGWLGGNFMDGRKAEHVLESALA